MVQIYPNKKMARNKRKKQKLISSWHKFAYKHTLSVIIFIIIFVLLLDTTIIRTLINDITALGYVGMLVTGVLFVSFFTAAPAVALLLAFADTYNPFMIAGIAGFGAMLGDYLILRFAEDKIGKELTPLAKRAKIISFIKLLHRKPFKPITASIGAIIIASPLPDEAGIALLGLSKISTKQLLVLTYVLNSLGILALLLIFS